MAQIWILSFSELALSFWICQKSHQARHLHVAVDQDLSSANFHFMYFLCLFLLFWQFSSSNSWLCQAWHTALWRENSIPRQKSLLPDQIRLLLSDLRSSCRPRSCVLSQFSLLPPNSQLGWFLIQVRLELVIHHNSEIRERHSAWAETASDSVPAATLCWTNSRCFPSHIRINIIVVTLPTLN